jgi:HSP20 family protein
MTGKGLKELARREKSRSMPPLYDIEKWFEDAWKKPFSLFSPSIWPDMHRPEGYEISPTVDVFEEGNELVMHADLPGMKKDDIKVDLSENILTLSGEKKRTEKQEKEDYYRYERSFGSFVRRFELPGDLDIDKVKAHFEDGVLELRIPMKAATRKHKKIAIH